jgi:hypothetical protein
VYVPAALIKVRMPSSLNMSLLGAEDGIGAAINASIGSAVPIAAPATGNTDKLRIKSRRFIFT